MSDRIEGLPSAEEVVGLEEQDIEFIQQGFGVAEILSEDQQTEVVQFLRAEFENIGEGDREELEAEWDTWRRQRIARPEQESKDTPWPNASNVTVPVSAMHTNGIYAHMKMSLSQRRPLLTARSQDRELRESMEGWTEFLDALIESPFHINYREKEKTIYYELASMGTQVVEIPWEERRVNFKRRDGDETEVVSKVIYEGPQVVPYKLEDVFVYPHWEDVQEAPYVLFRHRAVPRYRIEELGTMGFFENTEKLEGAQREELIDNVELEQRRFKQDDDVPDDVDEWDLFKAYYRYDADEDGLAEDLIVWFEPETSTVLRVEYNEIGWRPIVVFPYFKVPGNFYGMGVGHMTRDIQEEVDTMHNLGINSSVLSSLQMFVTKPGSGIGPNEQFYPLKQITAQNPREDFMPVGFPDVSGSTLQREQIAQQYAQQFTGASEAMMGLPDQTAKSGTSASLQTFLAQQGNKIFNTVLESVTDAISQMGLLITLQLVANGEKVKARLLDLVAQDKHDAVAKVLDMNVEDVPLKMGFKVQTTDVDETEDAKRQSILTMTQLYSQYVQEMLQLLPMLESPQAPQSVKQFVSRVYEGRTKLMEQTMELFGELDPESFTPFVKHIAFMNEQMEQRLGQQLEMAKDQQRQGGANEQADAGEQGVPTGSGGQPRGSGQRQQGMGMADEAAEQQGGAGDQQTAQRRQQQGAGSGQARPGQGAAPASGGNGNQPTGGRG